MTELVHSELKRCSDAPEVSDKMYKLLREAAIDAFMLKNKIECIQAWNLNKSV